MLEKIVYFAKNMALSDIHMHSDMPIAVRVHGEIQVTEGAEAISKQVLAEFIASLLDEEQKQLFEKQRDIDFAVMSDGIRFRANAYYTIQGPAMVMRKIETEIPSINTLGLPQVVMDITHEKNGLMLVTGPTGSGKSTTLAALIDALNVSRKENIITIEDPVEFIHKDKGCIISQREVGKDAESFASALKASLREDPDIILLGEMRDLETVSLALTAAETGHLVLATLHTNGAANSVNRILDVFPAAQQAQARSQLSQSLRLVVTQQLLPRIDKSGRIAAFEVMVCNTAVANLIRENKVYQISHVMQTGREIGMMTMQNSVESLVQQGLIDSSHLEEMEGV